MKCRIMSICMAALLVFVGSAQAKQGRQSGKSAKQYAPGQQKKTAGAKNAKQYAPGQQKKAGSTKSAKQYAPGQQKRNLNN